VDSSRPVLFLRALRSAPSRRDLVRGLVGAGLGLGFARVPDLSAAKKRKRKKKKAKTGTPNEFGCIEVGDFCTSEDQCCSGICAGKKGRKTCRAHDVGTCAQGAEGICTASGGPALQRCNNEEFCFCFQTTAGSNYCATPPSAMPEQCAECQTDADCEARGYPAGAACAPVSQGNCSGLCESGMACLVPCGTELPDPFRQRKTD
jgi:hypothetical protein